MLYQLYFMAALFTASGCWVLKVNKNIVESQVTSNVRLDCVYDGNDNGSPKLSEIYQIRILKFITNNTWDSVAKISAVNPSVESSFSDAKVKGHASTPFNSYLNISFAIASVNTTGKFYCEIYGLGKMINTATVFINETSTNVDTVLVDLNNKDLMNLKTEMTAQHEKIKSNVSIELSNQIAIVAQNLLALKEELIEQKQIVDDAKAVASRDISKVWPSGTYVLLKPQSGCPHSPSFDWDTGSIRVSTRPGTTNKDEISNPSHMFRPVLQHDDKTTNNYVYLESCVIVNQLEGEHWPNGHYCIQSYKDIHDNLLSPFTYSRLTFDRYNTGSLDNIVNIKNVERSNDTTKVYFWCIDTGEASNPIVLPTKDPFYLYRYGGTCQSVKGMDVTEEWVYFDTMKPYSVMYDSFHPDGDSTVDGIKIFLCYYTSQ